MPEPQSNTTGTTEQEYRLSRNRLSLQAARNGASIAIVILLVSVLVEVFVLEKVSNNFYALSIHFTTCFALAVLLGLSYIGSIKNQIALLITAGSAIYSANMALYFSLYQESGAYAFTFTQMLGIFLFGLITPSLKVLMCCCAIMVLLPALFIVIFSLQYLLVFDTFYYISMTVILTCVMAYFNDRKMLLHFKVNQELEAEKEKMKILAITDPLTGCFNRRHFVEACVVEFSRARRYSHPLTIMMIDIDHFKKINDQYGHAAGDETIRRVADVLQELVRESDILSRYGGEEFIILFPETTDDKAGIVAERMRSRIAEIRVFANSQETISLTVSLGISTLTNFDKDIESVVNRADIAMYKAKDAGRNQVSLH